MKRAQFIEWGIIVIALIFAFQFFEGILVLITQIIYGFDVHDLTPIIVRSLLVIIFYFVAFIVLLKNSGKLALYFSEANSTEETPLTVKIGKRSMLQVILIAICLFTLIATIADLIYYLFDAFKSEIEKKDALYDFGYNTRPDKSKLTTMIIQMVSTIVIIYFSRNIASFIIPKNEADELVFDSKPEEQK